MGMKFKRATKNIARPFKAAGRIGKAIGGAFGGGAKYAGEGLESATKYSEARARAAGAGVVNFTEEGWK